MKKFLSIILSLAMIFSLSSTALAAEPIDDQEPLIAIELDEVDLTKPFTQTIRLSRKECSSPNMAKMEKRYGATEN